ncbi:MAG: hypothetical protein ACPGJV_10000 [Bacteriovoracaceae bacterium]
MKHIILLFTLLASTSSLASCFAFIAPADKVLGLNGNKVGIEAPQSFHDDIKKVKGALQQKKYRTIPIEGSASLIIRSLYIDEDNDSHIVRYYYSSDSKDIITASGRSYAEALDSLNPCD